MRWLSFGRRGGERPGILIDEDAVLDVAARWPHWPRSWRDLLAERLDREASRALDAGDFARRHVRRRHELVLAPPVPDPSMALVVGRIARDLPAERALEAIAGVTAFNDVSGREAQFGDQQWFRGKSYDTFGPVGPWVVTLDAIRDPDDLTLRLLVNGEVRQAARTSEVTFGCATLVAWISAQLTLLPGDLIATGTPAGVGVFRDPPSFLQDGDRMEVHLEGVGVLRNRVHRPAPVAP